MSYTELIDDYTNSINEALSFYTKKEKGVVGEAMRYSLLDGGKRVRPVLALLTSQTVCDDWQPALIPAVALEMVHTYSLIHDDLPCMDDDDLRRGKPSCHRQFSENIAVLAGDALLTRAFQMLTYIPDASVSRECSRILSEAAGNNGMIHGQELDLADLKDFESLRIINSNKTGKMIIASVLMGAAAAGLDDKYKLSCLNSYSEKVGEVFQIVDDILDVTGTQDVIGKPVFSDLKNNKTTYVSLFGIDKAKDYAFSLTEDACNCLENTDMDTDGLKWYAKQLLVRIK